MHQNFQRINRLNDKSGMVQHIEEKHYQCLFNADQAFIIEQEKNYYSKNETTDYKLLLYTYKYGYHFVILFLISYFV